MRDVCMKTTGIEQSDSPMESAMRKGALMFFMNSPHMNLKPDHLLNRTPCGVRPAAREFIPGP